MLQENCALIADTGCNELKRSRGMGPAGGGVGCTAPGGGIWPPSPNSTVWCRGTTRDRTVLHLWCHGAGVVSPMGGCRLLAVVAYGRLSPMGGCHLRVVGAYGRLSPTGGWRLRAVVAYGGCRLRAVECHGTEVGYRAVVARLSLCCGCRLRAVVACGRLSHLCG